MLDSFSLMTNLLFIIVVVEPFWVIQYYLDNFLQVSQFFSLFSFQHPQMIHISSLPYEKTLYAYPWKGTPFQEHQTFHELKKMQYRVSDQLCQSSLKLHPIISFLSFTDSDQCQSFLLFFFSVYVMLTFVLLHVDTSSILLSLHGRTNYDISGTLLLCSQITGQLFSIMNAKLYLIPINFH